MQSFEMSICSTVSCSFDSTDFVSNCISLYKTYSATYSATYDYSKL